MAHPLLVVELRAAIRQELFQKGVGFIEALRISRKSVDSAVVDEAIEISPSEVKAELAKVGAIGDGTLIKFFTDFLNSDLGKALVKLLLSLIVV